MSDVNTFIDTIGKDVSATVAPEVIVKSAISAPGAKPGASARRL